MSAGSCPTCGGEMVENNAGMNVCLPCFKLRAMGVPPLYLNAQLSATGTLREALLSSDSLLLHGGTGRGKTYAAAALIRYRVENGIRGFMRFTTLPELLLDLRDTYRSGSEVSERQVIDGFSTVGLLILDDVGAEKTSEAVRSSLHVLIDRRANDPQTRTIITSNLGIMEIAGQHGQRIASRIAGMCRIIKLSGPDRRLTQTKSGAEPGEVR